MSTFRRPIDATESLRSTRRSLGDGTVAGRSRLAMPPANRARGAGRLRGINLAAVEGASTGETITVDADSVAVSATPTVVEFTAEVGERAGFIFVAPSDEIQPTFGQAYYDVQVSIDRGGYGGTLAVEILRGDEVVWGPVQDSYWSNPQVPVAAKGRLVDPAISPWRVRLTGSEAGTVTRVVAQVELVDRPRLDVPVAPEDTGSRLGYGVEGSSTGGVSRSVTPGVLDDVEVGDVLLFVAYYAEAFSGSPYTTWTPPSAGLTLLHLFPLHQSGGNANRAGVWWRRATQDDLDGVNVYTTEVAGGSAIKWTGIAVMPLFGLGTVGNPFATVNDAYTGSAPANLTVAAPGSPRTLIVSWAVRNMLTVPVSGNYEQTPQTPNLDNRYFWITPSTNAPTTGQFFGFSGSLGDLGGTRRAGMFRVLTADADTGAQIKYGESLTHHGLIAVGIDG